MYQFKVLISLCLVVHVQFLDNSCRVFDYLWIICGSCLGERLNDGSNHHLLKLLSTLFVNTKVADGEESNSSWWLRRAFIVSYDIKKLFQGSMFDQVTAQSVGVTDKVTQGSCSIGSSLFFLISKKFYEKRNTRFQMFIKHIVVEASISNSKTSKLSRVSIRISAALNGCRDKPKLKQFLIEEASMSTQITDKVAHLGSNWSILMNNQILEIVVNIWIMNIFIKVFRNSSQLRNQTQSINN